MGILGSIGRILFGSGSNDSSRTNYDYRYEPDKVKIAQIESNTKLRLADKELDRIALSRDAQLELMKLQVWGQQAIEEAKAQGMASLVQKLTELQKVMDETAQQRLALIEGASMAAVQEAERFYGEMEGKIDEHSRRYMEERLPKLLDLLGQYEEGSAQHELYKDQINADRARELEYVTEQVKYIHARLGKVIDSVLQSKEAVLEQTAALTRALAEQCLQIQGQNTKPGGRFAGSGTAFLTGSREAAALAGGNKQLPAAQAEDDEYEEEEE